jgi:hypothetical protein
MKRLNAAQIIAPSRFAESYASPKDEASVPRGWR